MEFILIDREDRENQIYAGGQGYANFWVKVVFLEMPENMTRKQLKIYVNFYKTTITVWGCKETNNIN